MTIPSLVEDGDDGQANAEDVWSSCSSQHSHGTIIDEEGAVATQNGINFESNVRPSKRRRLQNNDQGSIIQEMMKRPGEVAFFRLLHSELHKARRFFDGAQKELQIREERIRESINIVKSTTPLSETAWSNVFKSLYKLNTKLLLLETYAIMSFCSFSKILKKHDKVTGFNTRMHFMEKLVKTSNFADYPEIKSLIARCETGVKEVLSNYSKILGDRRSKYPLFEDEQLFIHMVQKLNDQARGTAIEEGATKISQDMCENQENASFIEFEDVVNSKSKLASYLYDIVDQYGKKIETENYV